MNIQTPQGSLEILLHNLTIFFKSGFKKMAPMTENDLDFWTNN